MKLMQTHIDDRVHLILWVDCCRLMNHLYCCFLAGVEYKTRHVSAYSKQQLWIGCSLYSLRVKIAYLDTESKLANHRFVNILAFESAI